MRAARVALIATLTAACAASPPGPQKPRPSPSWEEVQEADRLRRRGDWQGSERLYRQALQRDGGNQRAHAGLQETLVSQGRTLTVRGEYLRMPPGFASARIEVDARRRNLGFEASDQPWRSLGYGMVASERGDRRVARWEFERATRIDPGLAPAWMALGRARLSEGRLGLAEHAFMAALWADPGLAMARLGLSVIADRRGELADAFAWSLEAFRHAPAEGAVAERVQNLAQRMGRARWMSEAGRLLLRLATEENVAAFLAAGALLSQAGEGSAAERAFERASQAGATAEEIRSATLPAAPARVREFLRPFVRGVEARYRHYSASGQSESFESFMAWTRQLYERTTGRRLGPAGRVREFSFVGRLVDATLDSDDPLVRAFAAEGLLLVVGQRSGGPPEALVAQIARREPRAAVTVRGLEVSREVVWIFGRHLSGYSEWAGEGDIAGLALEGLVLVDLAAVARWEGDLLRKRARLAPWKEEILSTPALPARQAASLDDPADVGTRILLTAPVDFAAEVLVHENAHLVDAELHLPVGRHPWRNLSLALSRGLSPTEILAYLERNAQLAAIAEGATPRASFAVCCAMLGNRDVHARGYAEIVEGFVRAIHARPERYPAIDATRQIVQQLHLLTEEEVRALALMLQRRWGVTHGADAR